MSDSSIQLFEIVNHLHVTAYVCACVHVYFRDFQTAKTITNASGDNKILAITSNRTHRQTHTQQIKSYTSHSKHTISVRANDICLHDKQAH